VGGGAVIQRGLRRLVLLDDEAVQALMTADHRKHRRVLAHVAVVGARKKKAADIDLMVPTAARVEAGWDRTAPGAAFINLLRIRDAALDTGASDAAAALVSDHGVSVADAHVGAVVTSRPESESVTILTRDPRDIRTVCGPRTVTVVRL
jgi:hypothetical protein